MQSGRVIEAGAEGDKSIGSKHFAYLGAVERRNQFIRGTKLPTFQRGGGRPGASRRASRWDQPADRSRLFGYPYARATERPCGYPRWLAAPPSPPCVAG